MLSLALRVIAQGYWILVEDLELGDHTIDIVSGLSEFDFQTSVTYHLTIDFHKITLLYEYWIQVVSKSKELGCLILQYFFSKTQ
jgi:hypothetical protein